jgi:hypothetical protein
MRIRYQSFIDPDEDPQYTSLLQSYLDSLAGRRLPHSQHIHGSRAHEGGVTRIGPEGEVLHNCSTKRCL